MIVAGVGCRRDCKAEEIVAVVADAQSRAGRFAERLAVPHFKFGDFGPMAAAETMGMALVYVDDAAIAEAQPRCVTLSETARRHTGFASISEAVALGACGAGARLVLPRIAHARATCALAETAA